MTKQKQDQRKPLTLAVLMYLRKHENIAAFPVFKIRSETCRTEAQFCQNLYIFIYDKEGKLAGPTQILPVSVRGPALILKTAFLFISQHWYGTGCRKPSYKRKGTVYIAWFVPCKHLLCNTFLNTLKPLSLFFFNFTCSSFLVLPDHQQPWH